MSLSAVKTTLVAMCLLIVLLHQSGTASAAPLSYGQSKYSCIALHSVQRGTLRFLLQFRATVTTSVLVVDFSVSHRACAATLLVELPTTLMASALPGELAIIHYPIHICKLISSFL